MKNSYRSFAVFFLLFSFSILFISCSQESGITTPNEGQATSMVKNAVIPTVKINHDVDTVIILPQSHTTIIISKSVSMDRIALMDDYLMAEKKSPNSKKSTAPITQSIKPDLRLCQYEFDTVTFWEAENYSPAQGKTLGICTNEITWSKANYQYGFSKIFVTSAADIDNAYSAGYSYDNMMYQLNLPGYSTDIQASNSGGRHVGSYYIDEPIERGVWTPTLVLDAASLTSKPVMLGSFKFPVSPQYYDILTNKTYGQIYGPLMSSANNLYIMCDKYYGNCLGGHTYEYWNEFHGYYCANKNFSNWFHVVINNGNGISSSCQYAATSWITLLTTADGKGINEVWLYAQDTGDETGIANCCASCWQDHWLTQFQRQRVNVLINTGTTCSPNGPWGMYDTWYTGRTRYASY